MSNSITPSQRATILSIELKLDETFNGNNKRDAMKFINKHWDALMNTKSKLRAPNKTQMIMVGKLENSGCPSFDGKTSDEAKSYIAVNKERANFFHEYWSSFQQ